MSTSMHQLGGRGGWPPPHPENFIESSVILQHFEYQLTSDSLWRRKLQRLCHYKALFPGLPPHRSYLLRVRAYLLYGCRMGEAWEQSLKVTTRNHIYLYKNRMNLRTVQTMGNNLFESETFTFVANLAKIFITLEVQV